MYIVILCIGITQYNFIVNTFYYFAHFKLFFKLFPLYFLTTNYYR
jgi:hypothetical protein